MTTAVSTEVARFCKRIHADRPGASGRIACAPGVIDVMGGLGERTGSLLLMTPLRTAICIAAHPRTDGRIEIAATRAGHESDPIRSVWSLDAVAQSNGDLLDGLSGLPENLQVIAAAALATVHEAAQAGLAPQARDGLSLAFQLTDYSTALGAIESAAAAATLEAVSATGDLNGQTMIECLRRVARRVELGGARYAIASSIARARTCLQFRDSPALSLDQIALPAGVTLAAIECHPLRPILRERVFESDAASAMGHAAICASRGQNAERTPLSNIAPAEYVDQIRHAVPAKISGAAFLKRFGPIDAAMGTVKPDQVYKPRSRVEHHIYEHQRVHEFAGHLHRAARTADDRELVAAGNLMYASHWSHSQRYGLGSVETDALVAMIRARGAAQGLYGAKLASGWYGGLVTVLMKDSATTLAALQDAADAATRRFESPFRVLSGSDSGASVIGARETSDIMALSSN